MVPGAAPCEEGGRKEGRKTKRRGWMELPVSLVL
jgi:hypothetical protein